jgi:ABC-type sugar transport system ATPase subunit
VPLLEGNGVDKAYPGVQALAGVDFNLEPGEVHALLGENGAGKSTLMKVIGGTVLPDAGEISLEGDALELGSPERARSFGIAIVYQELSLVPSLSVAENVLLGRWPTTRFGAVDWKGLHRIAGEQLDRIGFDIDPRAQVRSLGMAERQLVEIVKALSNKVRVLLLDEPTSALSERESERLFAIIDDLRASGVGIVYVSHRLSEVLRIADRITVLRDGRTVGTVDSSDVSETDLARMMVGREMSSDMAAERRPDRRSGEPALEVRGLARPPRLKPIDLEVGAGEVVAVFGLVGAGRTRLARTLFGLEPPAAGSIRVFGNALRSGSPVDSIAAGLGYLGEDRAMGVVPRMKVVENVTLASLDRLARGPVLDSDRERALAGNYVRDLDIKASSLDQLAETLSGGNQQKVVLARWLCTNSRVLILDDPTRGIDVGAKEEVFRLVRGLASEGMAILYLTSEIKEAKALADRILVMSAGRVVRSMDPDSEEGEIMAAAGGVHG